jgi:hypothetical protein
MVFNDLIKAKVKRRLKKIYRKREKWNGAKGPFDKSSIIERELVLMEQFMLEKLVTKL